MLGPVPLHAQERGITVSLPYPEPCSTRPRKRGTLHGLRPYVDAHARPRDAWLPSSSPSRTKHLPNTCLQKRRRSTGSAFYGTDQRLFPPGCAAILVRGVLSESSPWPGCLEPNLLPLQSRPHWNSIPRVKTLGLVLLPLRGINRQRQTANR